MTETPHLWGTAGRKFNGPQSDDRCLRCGARYRDLPMSVHEVNPDLAAKS